MEGDERKHWLFLVISEINPKYHSKKKMWSIKTDFLREAVARERDSKLLKDRPITLMGFVCMNIKSKVY